MPQMIVRCGRLDCFGCDGGKCRVLAEPLSRADCPFYKTEKQADDGRELAIQRLEKLGRQDLLESHKLIPIPKERAGK